MPDDSSLNPLKTEVHDLLAAIEERARAEERLEAEFADTGEGQRALTATLRSANATFDAERNRVQEEYEAARPRC